MSHRPQVLARVRSRERRSSLKIKMFVGAIIGALILIFFVWLIFFYARCYGCESTAFESREAMENAGEMTKEDAGQLFKELRGGVNSMDSAMGASVAKGLAFKPNALLLQENDETIAPDDEEQNSADENDSAEDPILQCMINLFKETDNFADVTPENLRFFIETKIVEPCLNRESNEYKYNKNVNFYFFCEWLKKQFYSEPCYSGSHNLDKCFIKAKLLRGIWNEYQKAFMFYLDSEAFQEAAEMIVDYEKLTPPHLMGTEKDLIYSTLGELTTNAYWQSRVMGVPDPQKVFLRQSLEMYARSANSRLEQWSKMFPENCGELYERDLEAYNRCLDYARYSDFVFYLESALTNQEE